MMKAQGTLLPEKKWGNQMSRIPLRIANNFIEWGLRGGQPVTPLRLQKLLYLFYARNLHIWGRPSFPDDFEKWPKGPVLREVYETLKTYGGSPIDRAIRDIRGNVNRIVPDDEYFLPVFRDVTNRFGRASAHDLVALTHDGPPGMGYETAWMKAPCIGAAISQRDAREDGRVLFGEK
jgi:uncharacterized phage-associated protein